MKRLFLLLVLTAVLVGCMKTASTPPPPVEEAYERPPEVADEPIEIPPPKNESECNKELNSLGRDICLMDLAEYYMDESYCPKLRVESPDTCFTVVAALRHDEAICQNIQDENVKDYCIRFVEENP